MNRITSMHDLTAPKNWAAGQLRAVGQQRIRMDLPSNKFTWKSKWKLCRSAVIATLLTTLAFGIPLSMMRDYKSQGFIYVAKGGAKGTFTATGSGALLEIYGLFAVLTFMWLTAVYYLFQCGKKIWKGEYASAFPFQIGDQKVAVCNKHTKLGIERIILGQACKIER